MCETKTCSTCRETKPVTEFYRKGGGKPGYRYRCKPCDLVARKRGRSEESQRIYEIVMHHYDPSFPLSPEAEAFVYTDEPLPPTLLALYQKRLKLAEQGRLRRSRALRKLQGLQPMRFADLPLNEVAA